MVLFLNSYITIKGGGKRDRVASKLRNLNSEIIQLNTSNLRKAQRAQNKFSMEIEMQKNAKKNLILEDTESFQPAPALQVAVVFTKQLTIKVL